MSHDDKIAEARLNGSLVLKPKNLKPDNKVQEALYRKQRRQDIACMVLFVLCILLILGRVLL